jgi:hypothetical protein
MKNKSRLSLKIVLLLMACLSSRDALAAHIVLDGEKAIEIMSVLEVAGAPRIQGREGYSRHADSIHCLAGLEAPRGPGSSCTLKVDSSQVSYFVGAAATRLFSLLEEAGIKPNRLREGRSVSVKEVAAHSIFRSTGSVDSAVLELQ